MKTKGFTLIEVLIVVAIVFIIGAVIYGNVMGDKEEVVPAPAGPVVYSLTIIFDLGSPGAANAITKALKENSIDPGVVIGITEVNPNETKIFYLE